MNQEEVSHKNTANQYFSENRSMYEILEYNDIDKDIEMYLRNFLYQKKCYKKINSFFYEIKWIHYT